MRHMKKPVHRFQFGLLHICEIRFFRFSASRALSIPVRDTPQYRVIPFRDSIAEGGVVPFALFL